MPRDSHPAMLGAFVGAARNGTEPPATAADAAAALQVVLALYESAGTGRAVATD